MCKIQTAVSHSCTESKIISLDAGLRMDGLLALDLGDIVIEVLGSTKDNIQPKHTSHQETGAVLDSRTKTQTVTGKQKIDRGQRMGEARKGRRGNWPKWRAKKKKSFWKSGSTRREKNSPLCNADGHLSFQKCGAGTQVSKVWRQGYNVWSDMLTHMFGAAKKNAKQRWAIEKPKLDNARQLRWIFFI